MKKKIFFSSMLISISSLAFSQIGIHTATPQGSFNIDGAKDNPATGIPNVTQQSNDFTVLSTGNVGIGTTTPVGRLHLYNPSNGTEFGNDYVFDDESPISQIQGLVMRRSNAGGNLAQNDFIGAMMFNPKTNGAFGYGGAGIAGIYRGNGTDVLTALAFRINSNQEAARIDETGKMGIGTSTPSNRLDLGTSLGTSITDVVGKKLAVYNATDGTDFYGLGISGGVLQFHAASTVAEAPGMVLTGGGNVGIGAAANAPTNTLDVAGTTRVRTITPVTGATVVTPVYSDATGVLVKASPSATYGGVTSSTVNVASGATGTLMTGIIDGGIYKAVVSVGDACANTGIAEFLIINISSNTNYAIKGSDGLLSRVPTKAPTFTETNQTTTAVTWTNKPGCAGGDNPTSFNYTLVMPSAGTINVTNNGNITKGYRDRKSVV